MAYPGVTPRLRPCLPSSISYELQRAAARNAGEAVMGVVPKKRAAVPQDPAPYYLQAETLSASALDFCDQFSCSEMTMGFPWNRRLISSV